MNRLNWRGLIAAILAGGLSLTLIVAVTGAVVEGRPLGEKGGEVMVAICVAMIAAISTYFAMQNKNNNDKGDK